MNRDEFYVLLLSVLYINYRYSGAVNYLSFSHWQRQTEGPLWIAMATTYIGGFAAKQDAQAWKPAH